MLKVMIAEDEAIERKALKFLCDKFFRNELKVVCEAINGEDAIIKSNKYMPDIIFMDINMPILDGLHAAAEIKKIHGNKVEFIILTAYGYFEYAKEALKLGINDYLLKPSTNDEFCDAINTVIKKIDKRNEKEYLYLSLENKQKKMLPFLEREIIIKMIYGVQSPEKEYLEYLKMIDMNNKKYVCLILKTNEINKVKNNIMEKIKIRLEYNIEYSIGTSYTNEFIFLLFDSNAEKINKIGLFSKKIKEIENEFEITFISGISSIYKKPFYLHNAYIESKKYIKKESNYMKISTYDIEKEIFKKVLNENSVEALYEFDKLFDTILNEKEKIDEKIRKQLIEFIVVLQRNIIEFWGDDFNSFKINQIEDDINKINEIIKLKNYVKILINNVIKNIKTHKKNKNVIIIEEVKKYIKENYKKNISLEEVANEIELSSYYLSKLFKKTEKINFKDYLSKIRMEKAKEMLHTGNYSIKEISFELGYSDPNYFSRAFKKYVGISATDYSKLRQ